MVEGDQQMIVANPPYIMKHKDRKGVHQQVLMYEPEVALFLDDSEYFKWYDDFFGEVLKKLSFDGVFLLEGHEFHLNNLQQLLLEKGFQNTNIIKDLSGRDRFLKGYKGSR